MPSPVSSPTVQICRTCGGNAPVDVHFCPQCTKILVLGRQGNYFSFLGMPRKLRINPADLEQRFRALSRQFHPDYFYNATSTERLASLERSSYLNDAYRTLKDRVARIQYLLELEGAWTAEDRDRAEGERSKDVPKALLEEVFALNEELDDVRAMRSSGAPASAWQPRLQAAAKPIRARRDEHEQQLEELSTRWDAVSDREAADPERRAVLAALRERVLERNYINNLLAGIDKELAE
jgi:molecular chaperone HscB